jgi:hypothetical protein
LDVDKLPEEASEILEVAATEKEAQLNSTGQQATHIALDALALAVLDMSIVDRTIEAIAKQVLMLLCISRTRRATSCTAA